MHMKNQERSSIARIISFVVLLGIIPAWFFYIGVRYKETISIVSANDTAKDSYYEDLGMSNLR